MIERLSKSQAVRDLEITPANSPRCEDYALNTCSKTSHKSRTSPKATKPGQVLHLNIAGPSRNIGTNMANFFVVCKDEFSGFRMVSCVRRKSEVATKVRLFINQALQCVSK